MSKRKRYRPRQTARAREHTNNTLAAEIEVRLRTLEEQRTRLRPYLGPAEVRRRAAALAVQNRSERRRNLRNHDQREPGTMAIPKSRKRG